jgi:hypothetical protein
MDRLLVTPDESDRRCGQKNGANQGTLISWCSDLQHDLKQDVMQRVLDGLLLSISSSAGNHFAFGT